MNVQSTRNPASGFRKESSDLLRIRLAVAHSDRKHERGGRGGRGGESLAGGRATLNGTVRSWSKSDVRCLRTNAKKM